MQELGLVGFREPFARLFNQGMIYKHGAKMSKSKGNVVDPTSSSTATAPTPCALSSSSSAPPTRTWSGTTRASRASGGS